MRVTIECVFFSVAGFRDFMNFVRLYGAHTWHQQNVYLSRMFLRCSQLGKNKRIFSPCIPYNRSHRLSRAWRRKGSERKSHFFLIKPWCVMFSEFVSDIFNESCNRFNGSASATGDLCVVEIISSSYHTWFFIAIFILHWWGLLECPPLHMWDASLSFYRKTLGYWLTEAQVNLKKIYSSWMKIYGQSKFFRRNHRWKLSLVSKYFFTSVTVSDKILFDSILGSSRHLTRQCSIGCGHIPLASHTAHAHKWVSVLLCMSTWQSGKHPGFDPQPAPFDKR